MKKLFLIVPLLIMTVSGSLMAKTGFEVNVLIPFGFSMGTYTGTDASKYKKADTAFEFGIHVIPGYYFGLSSVNLGIGLDLGYQKDVFAFSVSGESQKHGYSFDSFHDDCYLWTFLNISHKNKFLSTKTMQKGNKSVCLP